jgi:dipeptidyl aminopeptidase/acylaminoacyl peptidase
MHWSDAGADYKKFGLPVLLGDPKADAERFKATSPVEQAARIKAPVLLAHGGRDRRVPVENGEQMRDALKRAGKQVDWVLYSEEGHSLQRLENEVDLWTRVEKFLAQHLR